MSDFVKEKLAADLEAAKVKGGARAGRILEIVRDAGSQAFAEVKGGTGELGAIAKNTLTTVVNELDTSAKPINSEVVEPVAEPVVQPEIPVETQPVEPALGELIGRLLKVLTQRLLVALNLKPNTVSQQYRDLKDRVINLDAKLTETYGDRYTTVRQRVDQATTWYQETATKAKAANPEPTALDLKQVELEQKAGEAGVSIAQKEQQIKAQIKELIQNTVRNG